MNDVKKILVENGLDFTIEKLPLFAIDSEGNNLITPYFGLLNSKTKEVINTCKLGYHVSQNEDILNMVLKGISEFGNQLTVSKAGSINGGRRVFLQLAIEGESKIGDDIITRYVTIIDSNDGSTSLSVGISDVVAHCTNQFFKFYKAGEAKFRHTATLEQKIASIPSLIELALDKSMEQVKIYQKFQSTPLTKTLAEKVIKEVLSFDTLLPMTARQQIIHDNLINSINIEKEYCGGENIWSLFNGVTRFTTHHQSVPKRLNGKEESLISGTAYKKAIKAFNLCVENI